MKGSTPPQIAEIIIKLVKDMAAVSTLGDMDQMAAINQKVVGSTPGHGLLGQDT